MSPGGYAAELTWAGRNSPSPRPTRSPPLALSLLEEQDSATEGSSDIVRLLGCPSLQQEFCEDRRRRLSDRLWQRPLQQPPAPRALQPIAARVLTEMLPHRPRFLCVLSEMLPPRPHFLHIPLTQVSPADVMCAGVF